MQIKFGTDGWRAIIAQEFTTENVARVARLINEVQLVDSNSLISGKVLGLGTVLIKEIAGVDNDVAFVKFNSVDGATVARNTDMILTVKASVGALAEAADSGLKIVVSLGAVGIQGTTSVVGVSPFTPVN